MIGCFSLFKSHHQMCQVLWQRQSYLNWGNFLEVSLYLLAILLVLPVSGVYYNENIMVREVRDALSYPSNYVDNHQSNKYNNKDYDDDNCHYIVTPQHLSRNLSSEAFKEKVQKGCYIHACAKHRGKEQFFETLRMFLNTNGILFQRNSTTSA